MDSPSWTEQRLAENPKIQMLCELVTVLADGALVEESIGNAALIEHLNRARCHAPSARAHQVTIGSTLDHGDVGSCQRQFAGQHQTRRTRAHDDYLVLRHPARRLVNNVHHGKLGVT